jgi:hypothetical protein
MSREKPRFLFDCPSLMLVSLTGSAAAVGTGQEGQREKIMRKLLLSAVALTSIAVASPAVAKDNSFYVGADIGALWANSQKILGAVDFTNPAVTDIDFGRVGRIKYKTGFDVDLVGGYDFGMFRAEAELGNKHA